MTDWYLNPVFDSFAVVFAVTAGLLALVAVAFVWRQTTPGRAAVLATLRVLAVLVLAAAMLQPTWVTTRVKTQTAALVVLLDASRSMLVPDMAQSRTRWEELRRAILRAQPQLAALGAELEIKCYAFDAATRTLAFEGGQVALPEQPTGGQTAIGGALEEALRQERGKRLAGVILLSDGAQQTVDRTVPPQDPARRLANLGCPLYTICFGGAAGGAAIRDVAVSNLAAGPTVYVKNELAVHADLQIEGYANQDILVELLWGAGDQLAVVEQRTVKVPPGETRLPLDLRYEPQQAGEHKLTVRAAAQAGELVTTNNQRTTYVTVLPGGLKVLYLEGALGGQRIEQAFLRRSLAASPDIQVDFKRFDPRNRAAWAQQAGQLEEAFRPGKYDVYMFGDVDADVFNAIRTGSPERDFPQLEMLRQTIEKRAGFIMLGGFHSFGPGGWGDTPLAKVLPLEMDRFERQPFGQPIRTDLHHSGPLKMRPTAPLGIEHPVMRLGPPSQNVELWNQMPMLDGANLISAKSLKPTAKVLAEGTNGKTIPLLISTEYGDGRVLAFAADSTWRWRLQGREAEHKRFWRQVVLWLAHHDVDQDQVWVKLERRTTPLGRPLRFTCGANGPTGEPLPDAEFTATVEPPASAEGSPKPSGKQPLSVRVGREGDSFGGTFVDTSTPGEFVLAVTAQRNGQSLGTARARFLVEIDDLELSQPAPDPQLMKSLAQITAEAGGQYVQPEELGELLTRLQAKPKELDVEIPYRWTFGTQPIDSFIILGLFVTLLGVEWFCRKKWGLV